LYRTWLRYGLLIFPGQHLSNDDQVAFAKRFGALEFGLAPLSNVRADGSVRTDEANDEVVKVLKGNMGSHCDSTYMPVQAKGAVFAAHVVPPAGGETGWADMCAAYAALDAHMKARIENLRAYHSVRYSQAKAGYATKDGAGYGG
jgi:alpha-ketoglutarate-dependent taurine dioxygenase